MAEEKHLFAYNGEKSYFKHHKDGASFGADNNSVDLALLIDSYSKIHENTHNLPIDVLKKALAHIQAHAKCLIDNGAQYEGLDFYYNLMKDLFLFRRVFW